MTLELELVKLVLVFFSGVVVGGLWAVDHYARVYQQRQRQQRENSPC